RAEEGADLRGPENVIDGNEYTLGRRGTENRGHGLDPFVQVDAYPIVPSQAEGLQTSCSQARRTPKLGIAPRYIAEGNRGRPAELMGHLLQEVVQICPHAWLRSSMNRSNSSVSVRSTRSRPRSSRPAPLSISPRRSGLSSRMPWPLRSSKTPRYA